MNGNLQRLCLGQCETILIIMRSRLGRERRANGIEIYERSGHIGRAANGAR